MSHMGQNRDVGKAILEYMKIKSWATPKELCHQLAPKFNYPQDTFRRLVHRYLRKSKRIVKHPIKPFYVLNDPIMRAEFDMMIRLEWYNMVYSEGWIDIDMSLEENLIKKKD